MNYKLLTLIASIAVSGCAVAPQANSIKSIWVNPKVSQASRVSALNRDGNQCHKEALVRISAIDDKPTFKKVSFNYFRDLYSGNTTPVYNSSGKQIGRASTRSPYKPPSFAGAFNSGLKAGAASASPRSNYNARMLAYIKACMAGKGWRQTSADTIQSKTTVKVVGNRPTDKAHYQNLTY